MAQVPLIQRLQSIDSKVLYALLIVATVVPLFIPGIVVPTKTSPETEALYIALSEVPEGGVVVIETDWTVSSRGESQGQLEAVFRVLRERNAKFVFYSGADPQAPQVARNVLRKLNSDLEKEGKQPFKPWEEYVDLGYFPQLESFAKSMATDLRKAWGNRVMPDPTTNTRRPVFESPVLSNVKSLRDCKLFVVVTASGTPKILIQRFGSPSQVPMIACVTGVMGPEHLNYYTAGQLQGLSVGLRGIVEMETMMANGVNFAEPGKEPVVKVDSYRGTIPPLTPGKYFRGMSYFASLHTAMTLLIVAVILGNLGLIAKRRRRGN